jgi:hypothetical protein
VIARVVLVGVVPAMVSAAALYAQQPARGGGAGTVTLVCARDAATGAPVIDVMLERRVAGAWQRLTRSAGGTALDAACGRWSITPGDALRVRRLGYAPWTGALAVHTGDASGTDTLIVALAPVASLLPASVTRATVEAPRAAATMEVAEARALGVGSTGALVALLPFAQPRSARGEVAVSLRGARREQVAVTLDGLPLTDPATGVADVADVPLAAIGGASVAPGSDPLGAGPGAIGGVLALHGGMGSLASARVGAFGSRQAEGALDAAVAGGRLRVGASRQEARNDFAFTNSATTTGLALEERRVNNDVQRDALFAHWRGDAVQVTALGTVGAQGLVGPVNVRDADEDRARTHRLFLRVSTQRGRTLVTGGVRQFGLGYRDPGRPQFDADAEALAGDVEARRLVGGTLLQAGVGADRLRATGDVRQDRARGHVSASRLAQIAGVDVTAGGRLDAVAGNGTLPSFSLAVEHTRRDVTVGARVAQAVRVPTLYDLYFSSPQRLTVRALRAERVRYDGELFARWRARSAAHGALALDAALVARDVGDAIVWFPGNFGWSPANVGREVLRGAEARAAWRRGRAQLAAWGAWYDAELRTGALRIPTPYVARESAGALVRVPLGPLEAGAAARWLGPRPFTAGPRDPAFTLPAVALIDVSLAARRVWHGRELLLALALDNATDRAWQSVRGFPAPGRAWSLSLTLTPRDHP